LRPQQTGKGETHHLIHKQRIKTRNLVGAKRGQWPLIIKRPGTDPSKVREKTKKTTLKKRTRRSEKFKTCARGLNKTASQAKMGEILEIRTKSRKKLTDKSKKKEEKKCNSRLEI